MTATRPTRDDEEQQVADNRLPPTLNRRQFLPRAAAAAGIVAAGVRRLRTATPLRVSAPVAVRTRAVALDADVRLQQGADVPHPPRPAASGGAGDAAARATRGRVDTALDPVVADQLGAGL